MRVVTTWWGLMEGKAQSRSEVGEPNAKRGWAASDIGGGALMGCEALLKPGWQN